MSQLSGQIISLSNTALHARTAPDQGGLLTGTDPTRFDTADPLRLWIIQVGIIIIVTQILSIGLRKLRQPRVIAEVLGGIILGPTAFGRIPGFTEHIFPSQSLPYLSLVANMGLCLFLFLMGLEINTAIIRRNWRPSIIVTTTGITIPFGLGAVLSVPLYRQFANTSQVSYSTFMLFTGVAYSITALPLLCRILTELKLFDTTLGVVVISAGVGNDIVGWILLALSVALVNSGSGVTAVWILLVCIGWTIFMLFIVRKVVIWVARNTGSIENGPTMFFMTFTMVILFGSAFFTDVIGVHAIFGAFLAGVIVPRDGGLTIALAEKLEDIVTAVFLPLYFTFSGLSTDLGLLNTGKTWGFTIAVILIAFTGKFGGCALAARCIGFSWREAGAIGSLMSCKGLLELIALNVGLSAGILTKRVFSMFVLKALVLTFATTPTVCFLYPPRLHTHTTLSGPSSALVCDHTDDESGTGDHKHNIKHNEDGVRKRRFTVVLDKFEHLPSILAITQLLQPPPPYSQTKIDSNQSPGNQGEAQFGALRLIELADRLSDVMKSSATDSLLHTDPLVAVFRAFAELNGLRVSTALSVVPFNSLATSIAEHVSGYSTQLVLVPWLPSAQASEVPDTGAPSTTQDHSAPFDSLIRADHSTSLVHSQFVRSVFEQAGTNVALLFGHTPFSVREQTHLFLPFFGGPDDRLALDFVVQLCTNPRVSATVARITKCDIRADVSVPKAAYVVGDDDKAEDFTQANAEIIPTLRSMTTGFPNTNMMYDRDKATTQPQTQTADDIAWARYAAPSAAPTREDGEALSRVTFEELAGPGPLHAALQRVRTLPRPVVVVVVGRSRRLAVEDYHAELRALEAEPGVAPVHSDVRKTIGDVGTAFVVAGIDANLLVMQASSGTHSESAD